MLTTGLLVLRIAREMRNTLSQPLGIGCPPVNLGKNWVTIS